MTCTAARRLPGGTDATCGGEAVGAVQWRDRRQQFRPGARMSRCEPVCAGHDQALKRYVRDHPDPFTTVVWLDLRGYAAYLARIATTHTIRFAPEDFLRR